MVQVAGHASWYSAGPHCLSKNKPTGLRTLFSVFRTNLLFKVAYDRLRKRGRKEEAGVPMQFIEVGLT